MAVNITEVESLYDKLIAKATGTLDTAYAADKLDSESYAIALRGVVKDVLSLSSELVQNQEKIDKSNKLADLQAVQLQKDIETKQIEVESKKYQLEEMLPAQKKAILEKNNRENVSVVLKNKLAKEQSDKKLELMDKQIDVTEGQALTAEEQLRQLKQNADVISNKMRGELQAINVAMTKVVTETEILKGQKDVMLEKRVKDMEMLDRQLEKVQSETMMLNTQRDQLNVSVRDNRLIRSMQAQADMINGLTMAKLQPTGGMVYEFYKIAADLAGHSDASLGTSGSDTKYTLEPAVAS